MTFSFVAMISMLPCLGGLLCCLHLLSKTYFALRIIGSRSILYICLYLSVHLVRRLCLVRKM